MPEPGGELSEKDARVIGEAYEVEWHAVLYDAHVVQRWQQPADELLVWLCTRHRWQAEMAVFYLTALRSAEGGGIPE
jgi:hypothetical protein